MTACSPSATLSDSYQFAGSQGETGHVAKVAKSTLMTRFGSAGNAPTTANWTKLLS